LNKPFIGQATSPSGFKAFPEEQMVADSVLNGAGGFNFELVFIRAIISVSVLNAHTEGYSPPSPSGKIENRGQRHKWQFIIFGPDIIKIDRPQ
jgi:hypothetical protein